MQPSRIGGRLEHQGELSEGVGDLRDLQDSTSTNFGPAKPAPYKGVAWQRRRRRAADNEYSGRLQSRQGTNFINLLHNPQPLRRRRERRDERLVLR